MARITVEDCLKQIPNRFKLTLVATYRARQLAQGHAPKLDSKDKPTVTALREVATGVTGLEMLKKGPHLISKTVTVLPPAPMPATRGATRPSRERSS